MLNCLKVPATRWTDFAAVFLLLIAARWQALVQYTYSVDDYAQITQGGVTTAQFLGQKRFVLAALNETSQFLGLDLGSAPIVNIGLSCALAAWIIVRLLDEWCPDLPRGVILTAAVLVFAHPYTAELFTFRGVTLLHYIAYAAAAAAVLMVLQRGFPAVVAGTVLLALALGTYQVALNVYVVIAAFSVAFVLLGPAHRDEGVAVAQPRHLHLIGRLVLVAAAGTALYMAIGLPLSNDFPDPRSAMIGMDQIPERMGALPATLAQHFLFGNAFASVLVPQSSTWMLWGWVGIALSAPLLHQSVVFERRIGMVAIVAATGLVAIPACIGVLLASQDLWLPPRVLMPVGFVWAGAFLFAWTLSGRPVKRALQLSAWIVALVFVTKNQSILVDQWRVNMRDRAMVVQMVAALQDESGWGVVDTVAVVGSRFYFESPITTVAGNQNVSAFIEPHAPHAMFSEVTGRTFLVPSAEQVHEAADRCSIRDVPSEEFEAMIVEKLAIICRGPS